MAVTIVHSLGRSHIIKGQAPHQKRGREKLQRKEALSKHKHDLYCDGSMDGRTVPATLWQGLLSCMRAIVTPAVGIL
jgi:hypothetical protein